MVDEFAQELGISLNGLRYPLDGADFDVTSPARSTTVPRRAEAIRSRIQACPAHDRSKLPWTEQGHSHHAPRGVLGKASYSITGETEPATLDAASPIASACHPEERANLRPDRAKDDGLPPSVS